MSSFSDWEGLYSPACIFLLLDIRISGFVKIFSNAVYCDMTPESRNSEANESVNTFPRQRIRKQQSSNFRCYAFCAVRAEELS
jgi:hypothetical protein